MDQVCSACGSHELHQVFGETNDVCTDCGVVSSFTVCTPQTYKFESAVNLTNTISSDRPYVRKTHFLGILYQLSGISKMFVPPRIYDLVLTCESEEELQKKLTSVKERKYYSIATSIFREQNRLDCAYGRPLIRRLLAMFIEVESVWSKNRHWISPQRKSMLSYHFVLDKLCQRLGLDSVRKDLKPVKGKAIRKELTRCWELLEKLLHWDDPIQKPHVYFIECKTPDRYIQEANQYSIRTLRLHALNEVSRRQFRPSTTSLDLAATGQSSLQRKRSLDAVDPKRDQVREAKRCAKRCKQQFDFARSETCPCPVRS